MIGYACLSAQLIWLDENALGDRQFLKELDSFIFQFQNNIHHSFTKNTLVYVEYLRKKNICIPNWEILDGKIIHFCLVQDIV